MKFPAHVPIGCWATGLALATASTLLRYQDLAQTPFANGWDGYFYLVQLKAWVETGRMHTPEAALIYPLLRLAVYFTGDYVVALKACVAVLAGGFTAVVFWFARQPAPGQRAKPEIHPVLPAAWSVFSPQLSYFAAQYPKNLLGLVLLLAFVGSLPSQVDLLRKRAWLLPFLLLILNYFGHRLTFGLAVVYLLFWAFFVSGKNPVWRKPGVRAGLAIALSGFALAGIFLPGLFHLADFERLKGIFQARPQFAPYSFVSQFGPHRIGVLWKIEIGLSVVCWLYAGYRAFIRKEVFMKSVFGFGLCLLFPFFEWSFTGFSYRCFLVFVLFMPILASSGLVVGKQVAWAISAVLLAAAFFAAKSYKPALHDPDYALYDKVARAAHERLLPETELVIVHNSLAEYFTYTTGIDALPWQPEYPVAPMRLWRIAADVRLPELRYFRANDTAVVIQRLPGHYALLREDGWQKILQRARAENDTAFLERATSWQNPSKIRPAYLLRRKR